MADSTENAPGAYSAKTLFEAPPYDPARERRRKIKIAVIILVALAVATVVYLNRYWPEEHIVKQFFADLQAKDYKAAYGVWMHDPKWEQHPEKYQRYPFNEFYRDWGPGGEWGLIKNFEIQGALRPKGGSGVVVSVEVNGRAEPAHIWVENSDKTLSFSPY